MSEFSGLLLCSTARMQHLQHLLDVTFKIALLPIQRLHGLTFECLHVLHKLLAKSGILS